MTTVVEETIHGVQIRDPYRWLEDGGLQEAASWIRAQQLICDSYFDDCAEMRPLERIVQNYLDVVIIDQPARVGERYIYRKHFQNQEQACLCVRDISSGQENVLLDPSADGSYASSKIYAIASDGSSLAYEFGQGGEDRKEIRFIDLKNGRLLADRIPRGYSRGLAFALDGYFYCHETPEQTSHHEVRFHRFGSTKDDQTLLRLPRVPGSRLILKADERRLGAFWVRPQGPDLIADLFTVNYSDLPVWSHVFRNRRMPCLPTLHHGDLYALVETESRGSRVIQISETGEELRTVVPASEMPVRQLVFTKDRLFVGSSKQGAACIDCWSLEGVRLPSMSVPPSGSVHLLPGFGQDVRSIFFSFESFDKPPTIYEHVIGSGTSRLWCRREVPGAVKRCEIREVQVASNDGTTFPMTIVAPTDRVANWPQPMIMTSYGGFGAPMTPRFSVLVTILIELGAAFALPHIRGGGEFGKAWHDAGRARKRQAAFDDFIAAAEWLCRNNLTNPEQLGIFGGSNAGLLVGVAMTQRPDLFGAVLCIAPLLDMLRYECFDRAVDWRREYGTAADSCDFHALHAYSPYHHIADDTNYPPTMFVSGDKDDRCNPAHVRKMAAALLNRPAQVAPVIVDYSEERGHSPVLPLSMRVSALARRIAFLCRELNINVPEGPLHDSSCD